MLVNKISFSFCQCGLIDNRIYQASRRNGLRRDLRMIMGSDECKPAGQTSHHNTIQYSTAQHILLTSTCAKTYNNLQLVSTEPTGMKSKPRQKSMSI